MVSREAKRERLATVVGKLVHERGTKATTAGRIAARAGIARSSFYELFENREDALRYAIHVGEQRLLKAIEGVLDREDGWEERVGAIFSAFLAAAQADPFLAELALISRGAEGAPGLGPCNPKLVDALASALRPGWRGVDEAGGPRAEELLVLGVLGLVAGRLRRGEADGLLALTPELTRLATSAFAGPGRGRRNSSPATELG